MLLDKLKQIRSGIEAAARRSGRPPEAVHLVAVTKYATLDQIKDLLDTDFVSEIGESRVQAAASKKAALGVLAGKVRWRMIGHLQTNKARKALEVFDALDSLDSLKLAGVLDRLVKERGRKFPVLVQVKLSDKGEKSGVAQKDLKEFLENIRGCRNLDVRGLMGMAPEIEPVEETRPYFKAMREMFERHFSGRADAELSMGMSRDHAIAVEEGATHVRLGSTIFASRKVF